MNYKEAKSKNNIYFYPNTNFNTIDIELNFLAKNDNSKSPIYDLLHEYLVYTNNNYSSEDEILERQNELYNLIISFNKNQYGEQRMFEIYINMISPSVIGDDYSREAFEFISEMINEPDFTKQDELDQVKRNLIAQINMSLLDNETYSDYLYRQTVIPNDNKVYDYSTDLNYISDIIQSITLEDLEREYSDLVNNFYNGFVFGNLPEEDFNFFVDTVSLSPKKHDFSYHGYIPTIEGDIEIDRDAEQSFIYVTYDIDQLNSSQLIMLKYILNNGYSSRCHQVLREKYGLVYYASAILMNNYNKLLFYAPLDDDKKNKFLYALNEIVEEMQNPELLSLFIDTAKNEYFSDEYTVDEKQDVLSARISDYLLNHYDGLDRNEVNDDIKNMTSDDLIQKTKSLKRKNVFMVRGKSDE